MSKDPIERGGLKKRFWEKKSIDQLNQKEWEALCDGCGKCCLNKLEDEDTGQVALTRVACRLLDDSSCRCSQYDIRHHFIPECIVLKPDNLDTHAYWMPKTCAYRLIHEGRPLYDWHPLISGDPQSVHRAKRSVKGRTVPETQIPEDDWEDYIIDEEI